MNAPYLPEKMLFFEIINEYKQMINNVLQINNQQIIIYKQ